MKDCDILGVKTYSDLLVIFRGQDPQQPHDLRPCYLGSSNYSIHNLEVTYTGGSG